MHTFWDWGNGCSLGWVCSGCYWRSCSSTAYTSTSPKPDTTPKITRDNSVHLIPVTHTQYNVTCNAHKLLHPDMYRVCVSEHTSLCSWLTVTVRFSISLVTFSSWFCNIRMDSVCFWSYESKPRDDFLSQLKITCNNHVMLFIRIKLVTCSSAILEVFCSLIIVLLKARCISSICLRYLNDNITDV